MDERLNPGGPTNPDGSPLIKNTYGPVEMSSASRRRYPFMSSSRSTHIIGQPGQSMDFEEDMNEQRDPILGRQSCPSGNLGRFSEALELSGAAGHGGGGFRNRTRSEPRSWTEGFGGTAEGIQFRGTVRSHEEVSGGIEGEPANKYRAVATGNQGDHNQGNASFTQELPVRAQREISPIDKN